MTGGKPNLPIGIFTAGTTVVIEFTPKRPLEPVTADKISVISCGEIGKFFQ